MTIFPDTAAAVDLASPVDLLDLVAGHAEHTFHVTAVRRGAAPMSTDRVARHAVAALATGQAIVDQLNADRWRTVSDALVYGASLAEVASALNLTGRAVVSGLHLWLDEQVRASRMTAAQHDAALALVSADTR